MKGKSVAVLLKTVIAVAQSRKWTRDSFLHKVKVLWGDTPDVIAEKKFNYLRGQNSPHYRGELWPDPDLEK